MSDTEIIEKIKTGEHSLAIEKLYKNFPAFRNSLKKAGGKSSDAEDIFQDALVILIQKLSDQSFKLTCAINTFLFSICRNLSKEYFKKKGREINLVLNDSEPEIDLHSIDELIAQEHKFQALDRILMKVGEKCLQLLQSFYIKGKAMSDIALELGFKSENSAKTQKYKCLEKARNLTTTTLSEIKSELV